MSGGRTGRVADEPAGAPERPPPLLGDGVVGHAEEHDVGGFDALAAAGRAVHHEARRAEGPGEDASEPPGADDADGRGAGGQASG